VRYAATLTIVPSAATFSGEVDIDLAFAEPASFLWLDGVAITVREAHLDAGGRTLPARAVKGGSDFLGFAFGEAVPAGPARLHVAYDGEISRKDDRGVFREEEEGASYVFSQFENIDARRAFPCFDEPGYKTPWQLTLRVGKGDLALSNTPVVSETPEADGMRAVRFAETKPLPSYLVAFAVGPFELVDAGKAGKKGTPVRIATPRGQQARAAFAVRATPDLLARIEEYTGIPYPYEKLDVVPIPHLASFGAMENAGLITYRAGGMLARPEEDTPSFERGFAETIAHEMAHQWFGDLVTMAWWDDVWLNEAFATWMEEKIAGAYRPAWRLDLGGARWVAGAMGEDSLVTARRIRQPIVTKDDIQNAFDGITYVKGAAVLHMFESFAGEERFQKGIHRYLSDHAYGNATAADFLASVSTDAGREIAPAFSTFLDQPGVPVVGAELTCDKGKPPALALRQKRYLPIGSSGSADQVWQIPVCVRWGAGKTEGRACTLLAERTGALPLTKPDGAAAPCPEWVVLNAGSAGYYHAGYTGKALGALLKGGGKHLRDIERLSVARDLSAIVGGGDLPVGEALGRLPDILADPSPQILGSAQDVVQRLHPRMIPDDVRPAFARFVTKTFGARARAIGWQAKRGEDDQIRMMRAGFVSWVADQGDEPKLVAEAVALASRWLDEPTAVDADVVGAVLQIAAARGDARLWDRLSAELRKSKDDVRTRHLVTALAAFRDPALLEKSLALFLDEGVDPRVGWRLLLQDERNADVLLAFVEKRYDAVLARFPDEIRGDVPAFTGGFCDEAHRAEIDAFFRDKVRDLTGGPRTLAQTLEGIGLCAARRAAYEPSLRAFLKKR
jgi:alanyl aminopeptidase